MYLVKTPKIIQNLFPNCVWQMPTIRRKLYLTFDDGPIPEVTPWVLEQLEKYNAKATFFCVGENVSKYPEIFNATLEAGHSIGNHTYNHLSGWGNENLPYFHNVRKCAQQVKSSLFRPPYGRIKPRQMQFLQRHYQIVMWDVLSGDFDPSISVEACFKNVVDHAKKGSIIVFHDSLKAKDKLEKVLPKILEHYSNEGFVFERIEEKDADKKQDIRKIA